MSFAEKVLQFYKNVHIGYSLPEGVEVMNPYRNSACVEVCTKFYNTFYNDSSKRFLILGINPGRHGAGVTGIPFTDPVKLEKIFGISNPFPKRPELSAEFIHQTIESFGGHPNFFSKFFISSVSPLGFTRESKNLNYYDEPVLKRSLEPFIKESMETILTFGVRREVAFCLGEGENYKYLKSLNQGAKFFEGIIPLPHPRFIMQYRRKKMDLYVDDYVRKLNSVS